MNAKFNIKFLHNHWKCVHSLQSEVPIVL